MKKQHVKNRTAPSPSMPGILSVCMGLFFSFLCFGASAQGQFVTGKVIDASTKEPLVGVSVLVKGTKNGVITNIDGDYSLNISSSDAVLVFSYLGYQTKELSTNGKSVVDVFLSEENQLLNEVVVVGYGTMKKKDLTGSIVQIRPDKLVNENPKTVQDILRGTPGLSVGFDPSAKGGGAMEIRGQRSIYTAGNHNEPLIILDGMMFYGELSEINPDDISQIDVLKDASAAAIYGAKSSNGVIIITTKKGLLGKPKVNVTSNVSFSTPGVERKPYGPEGYLNFYQDWYETPTYGLNPETGRYETYQTTFKDQPGYYANPGNLSKYGISYDDWKAYTNNPDTYSDNEIWARRLGLFDKTLENYLAGKTFDWYKQTFRTGISHDDNVSISGANDQMNYYMSLGYLSNEGIVVGDDYSAIRSNVKVEGNVNKWLSVGVNINFQDRKEYDLVNRTDMKNWQTQILHNSPFSLHHDEDGNLIAHPMRDAGYAQGYNSDFDRQYIDMERGYTVLNTIFNTKIKLPFNVTYSFNASPRYQWYYNRYFESSKHPDWVATNGLVNREQSKHFDWSINNTINWEYTFAQKHRVNLTLAQEAEERQYWQDIIRARDFQPSDALGFHRTDNANKDKSSFETTDTRESADGMLARLFYSFDDRYMLTTSVRRDGYSAFGTSNPRATFYSTAFAWSFANEKFFRWEPMNMGKLRLSWGQNGNRSLANPYIALSNLVPGLGTQGYVDESGNYVIYQTLRVDRMKNAVLQWEKTTARNVGLDVGFLNNRFTATMDFYLMSTYDMIMNQTLPGFGGFGSIASNLGEVESKGFELSISTQNIKTENFEWNTTFSFSKNKNTIKHLYYTYEDVLDKDGNVVGQKEMDDKTNGWFIGKPVSAIWNYRVTGIWQINEIEEAARHGQRPGDPKVTNLYTADDIVNADGSVTPVYNDNDREILGQTTPPINWSMRNDFTIYKNLTLSLNIYSRWGHKSLNSIYLNRLKGSSEITNNLNVYVAKYWTPDNPTDKYGRLNADGPTGAVTPGKLYDRSFIRLENISLGYTLPALWTSKINVEKVKVFASIRNVAVWAKDWEYWDPETYRDDSVSPGGFAPRTYSLGLNVVF